MHLEYFSTVQLIRKGGWLSSCTSEVLTCTFEVERQYASKVSCSQFCGTPLLSGADARVTESRTVIRTASFCEPAFANVAASKRQICNDEILRILIKPTPPQCRRIRRVVRPRNPSGPVLVRRSSTVSLKRKNRPEFGSVILPFVGRLSSNCVYREAVLHPSSVDRLLEGKLAPVVEFVVQGAYRRLAHQHWQWGGATAIVGRNKPRIVEVVVVHLILADGEQ